MEDPPPISEFKHVLGRCASLFNVLDLAVLALREGERFSVLSARLTLRHLPKRPDIYAVQHADWFALRQWRDVHDLHELLRRAVEGAAWGKLFTTQRAELTFAQRPGGWFTNGFKHVTDDVSAGQGLMLQVGASWSNLFKTPAHFRDWENEVKSGDDAYDVAALVEKLKLRQPCGGHDHARQLHVELEFPLFHTSAALDGPVTRLRFASPGSEHGWKIKWKSGTSSGVEPLQRHGDGAEAAIAGQHHELQLTPVFEKQALDELRVRVPAIPESKAPPRPASPPIASLPDDRPFMQAAIDEARKSRMEPAKTPLFVGAVVVRNGEIIARGHRGQHKLGEHAEFTTLQRNLGAPGAAANATLYCTLEPCTHRNHPKRPCVEWIQRHKISRVVMGVVDPNPVIRGGGIKQLRRAGIDVQLFPADLASELEALNHEFESAHDSKQEPLFAPHLEAQRAVDETWNALAERASTLRTRLFRITLIAAARFGEQGRLADCLLHVVGSYEALRIHWQRTYRTAVGSDAPRLEMRLPLVQSPAAARLFPFLPWLAYEPRLAEDKHGPAALAELGFPLAERAAMQRLVEMMNPFGREPEGAVEPLQRSELMGAHRSLVDRVRQLEVDEASVMATIETRPAGWHATVLAPDQLKPALQAALQDASPDAPLALALFALDSNGLGAEDEPDDRNSSRLVQAIAEYTESHGHTFLDREVLCAILLPQADADAARSWIEQLCEQLAPQVGARSPSGGDHLSVGLAIATASSDADTVIDLAKRLLATARQHRDGRVEVGTVEGS